MKTYLVSYTVVNRENDIKYATTHGETSVQALVRLFEYAPHKRLNFVSITEVNEWMLPTIERELEMRENIN